MTGLPVWVCLGRDQLNCRFGDSGLNLHKSARAESTEHVPGLHIVGEYVRARGLYLRALLTT